jgi:hypothetical protein
MSSVAQVRRPRERDEPRTAGPGIRPGPIRADLEPRRIAGGARLDSTDCAYKITPALLRLAMPHERGNAHHLRQMDDGRDLYSAFPARFVHGNVWTRAGLVRAGQIRKRFCERPHQADFSALPCRTSRLPSEPVAREILVRSRTARPKRYLHWRQRPGRVFRRAALLCRSQMAHDQEASGFSWWSLRERAEQG